MRQLRQGIAAVLVVLAVAVVVQRAEAGPTADPATAAGYGGGWIARQINASGFVPATTGSGANLPFTVDGALALAASNTGGAAFTRAISYLHGQIDAFVKDTGGVDAPGALAKLIMLAVVAGEDPTKFGGTAATNDLVARLLATKRSAAPDAGLFGAQNPAFDGAFRQSLSIMALRAAASVPVDAVDWLGQQQCPDKGWQSYRADTTAACTATDPAAFAGEDTNSTAIAAQAFRSLLVTPPKGNPLDFLKDAQNADGGFGFLKGTATDANSTGLVLQAIAAGGESPTAGRWVLAGGAPISALLSLQLGCEAAEANRGAFDFQPQTPLQANFFATVQAVPGVALRPFPLAAGAPAATEPTVPCGTASTTTTTTAATTTTTAATTTTTTPTAPIATPIRAQPNFVG